MSSQRRTETPTDVMNESTEAPATFSKTVYIIRGLPGSGKTYLAKLISNEFAFDVNHKVRVCSVDHFMVQEDGTYKFDKRLVGRSHAECLASFLDAVLKGYGTVILDNTNSQHWEYQNYENIATAFGYTLKILEIECTSQLAVTLFHHRNIHGVPESAHLNMAQRWEPDSRAISIRPWFADARLPTSNRAPRYNNYTPAPSVHYKQAPRYMAGLDVSMNQLNLS